MQRVSSLQHFYRVANTQKCPSRPSSYAICLNCVQRKVYAKACAFFLPVDARQGFERLFVWGCCARLRMEINDFAARAVAPEIKLQRANAHAPPAIFLPGQLAINDDVGAKAPHGYMTCQLAVELRQRGLRAEQKGRAISNR